MITKPSFQPVPGRKASLSVSQPHEPTRPSTVFFGKTNSRKRPATESNDLIDVSTVAFVNASWTSALME